ncbi:MAG: hypothetical protein MUC80_09825 [Candidatus Thermoplasmatota archaeon]|jgi:hypothetical protein|nr:hypothetical protein [Candidatus Thermoplasmatota archaeon]
MKKKVKAVKKKTPKKTPPSKKTTKSSPSIQKMMVGEDEFCPTCMEWRSFDELTGKCTVCGRIIKKTGERRKITDEYDLKDFSNEHDEPQETNEF